MAEARCCIALETEVLSESLEALRGVHTALIKRHGPQFRALERKIESLTDGRANACAVSYLGNGALMAHASPELAAVLKEARGLGILQ